MMEAKRTKNALPFLILPRFAAYRPSENNYRLTKVELLSTLVRFQEQKSV